MARNSSSNEGFSLITISIVLLVSMMIMASMLPGGDAGDINKKTLADIAKLDKVENAMRSFMFLNGRRPCPASGEYAVTESNYGFRVDGVPEDYSGSAIATGDINNDSKADLVIGAYFASHGGRSNAGLTYVVFGGSGQRTGNGTWDGNWPATFALSSLNGTNGFRADGVDNGKQSGYAVETGDINGDGKTDLIIGAFFADPEPQRSDAGSTYVVYGEGC